MESETRRGRPPKPDGTARVRTVSVALTEIERARVLAEAAARGQTPSAWIHDLITLVLA